MKILVAYDSVFGNTEKIALAMADALRSQGDVQSLRVRDVRPEHLKGVELLIVGSPTRAFRPTKDTVDFLRGLPEGSLRGVKVAAFDTRISTADVKSRFLGAMVRFFGYAARPMADRLEKKGGTLVLPPEGFFVEDSEGPLKPGELERAAEWARRAAKGKSRGE